MPLDFSYSSDSSITTKTWHWWNQASPPLANVKLANIPKAKTIPAMLFLRLIFPN